MQGHIVLGTLAFLAVGVLVPAHASAQTSTGGTIAGVVRDTTGAVLPGVTVEASSPALIEKVRSAVTDGQGIFKIVDLNPGVYALTYSLTGFSTVKHEGLELSAGVTLTINADLRVGSLEETVIVSGQSPLVDVQNTTQHRTISRESMDALPTAKSFANLAVLVPGVTTGTQDVGGSVGDRIPVLAAHGSRVGDMPLLFDGMRYNNIWASGGGFGGAWVANNGMIEEMSIETSGAGADATTGGVRVNSILRQGGNRFSGTFAANFSNDRLQSNNLDESLIARGAASRTVSKKVWDLNPSFGGPIRQDKVWFWVSWRHWGADTQPPGAYHDINTRDLLFTQDLNRPAQIDLPNRALNGRVTWQTSAKSKLAVYGDDVSRCWCGNLASATVSYEASNRFVTPVNHLFTSQWSWTATNRLLVELGLSFRPDKFDYLAMPDVPEGPSVLDSASGIRFGYMNQGINYTQTSRQYNGKATVNYVTGSHNVRVGAQWMSGWRVLTYRAGGDKSYTVASGVPQSVTYHATPYAGHDNVKLDLGIFAQEQWTLKGFTVNAGARFDYLNAYIPEQHAASGRYVAARDFPRIEAVPNWKDLSPRLGVSYDLSGSGRTAVKWALNRYVEGQAVGIAEAVDPVLASTGASNTRAWLGDGNGNLAPDCDVSNPAANGECGPSGNLNFGTSVVATRYGLDTVTGWGTRGYNWETSIAIVHELFRGLSADVGYFRRTYGHFRVTDNALATPADYDAFCVTAPVDSRLPNNGGYQVCGLYDIVPTKFGLNDNVVTLLNNLGVGEQSDVFDGIDLNIQARLRGGVRLQGGTSTGRQRTNNCFVIDSPQNLLNCDIVPPFLTQIKLAGSYPLPWWDLQASATYQSLPGPAMTAAWSAPASAVQGLGRPLSGGARNVTVPLVKPGTLYGERMHQLDFRLAKNITVGRARVQGQVDLYNMLNGNAVLNQNNTFGTAWLRPTSILSGRLVKVGAQVNF